MMLSFSNGLVIQREYFKFSAKPAKLRNEKTGEQQFMPSQGSRKISALNYKRKVNGMVPIIAKPTRRNRDVMSVATWMRPLV